MHRPVFDELEGGTRKIFFNCTAALRSSAAVGRMRRSSLSSFYHERPCQIPIYATHVPRLFPTADGAEVLLRAIDYLNDPAPYAVPVPRLPSRGTGD